MTEPFYHDFGIVFLYDGSDRDAGVGICKLDFALIAFVEFFAVAVVTDMEGVCAFLRSCIIVLEIDVMLDLAVGYNWYCEVDVYITS